MKIANCCDCGVEYEVKSSRHVRCSDCGAQRRLETRREWFRKYRKENNEYFLEYARKRRREKGTTPAEERERNNRRMRRQAVLDMFGNQCRLCGYNRCSRSLHVHHIDRARKVADKDYQRASFTDFDNLVVLCSNCHFEVHDGLVELKH